MEERFIESSELTEAAFREAAQAKASAQAFSNEDLEPSQYKSLVCTDCEVELPLFRMQKGFTLCTLCQEALERQKGRQNRYP